MRSLLSGAVFVCLLLVSVATPALAQPDSVDVRIATLLDEVSDDRLMQILATLPTFGTRNTLSSTDQPAGGIGAARQWILDEMAKSSPTLQVRFDTAPPGAAGYKFYWREAWAPDWQHVVAVGPVTQFVMPDVSIDDFVFGVAALGADGSESLVSAHVNPPRAESVVKVK